MALEETDTTDPEQPDEQTRVRRAYEPGGGTMPAEARPEAYPSAQPGQQQGDPNAPGGPAPDPASFRQSPTNPSRGLQLASATPINPVDTGGDAWNTRPFGPNVYRPPAGGGPTQWGKDYWPIKTAESYPGVDVGNPNMPNPLESYPLSTKSSAELAKYAPDDVAKPAMQGNLLMNPISAIADAFSKGRFSHNFSESYMRGLAIQREEALQHWENAIDRYRQYFLTYGRILSEASSSKDPNRFHLAAQQIEEAAQGRDPDIIRLLHNGGLPAVEQHLNNQHALMLQLQSAATSIRKATGQKELEEERESEALGLPHSPGGIATGLDFPNLEEGGAKKAPEGARTPSKAEGEPEKAPTADFDAYAAKQSPLYTPQVLDLARKAYMGHPTGLIPHSPGSRAVEQATRFLDAQVNRVATSNPPANSNLSEDEAGQQRQDALNQVVPGLGDRVGALKTLQADPASVSMKGDERFNLVELTGKVWHGWNQGMYHAFQTVWNNDKSAEWKGLRALNRAGNELKVYFAAVNSLPGGEDDIIPSYVMTGLKQKLWTGESDYAKLNEPLRTLATDTVVINNMGGRAAVTPVNQLLREAPIYGSKRQLRALGVQIAKQLDQIRANTYDIFHRQTGLSGDPPASDPSTAVLIGSAARSNPDTGKFPKDAPIELKAIEPKTHAKGLTRDKTWEPMTQHDYEARRNAIEKMRKDDPNNPKLPILEHELGIVQ